MIYRISELDNEQVDYLRFDRIKIQRKRMEHILQVLKDLSFKNKQLMKDKALLKEQYNQIFKYKLLYEQLIGQRKILIQNNIIANSEIERFKEITSHQQILINSLKEQVYGIKHETSKKKKQFICDQWNQQDNYSKYLEDYIVLKAQYADLQQQYKHLYKIHYRQENQPKFTKGHKKIDKLFTLQRQQDEEIYNKILNKQNSNSKAGLIYTHNEKTDKFKNQRQIQKSDKSLQQTMNHTKLQQKYDKMKKVKRELVKLIKDLQGQLDEQKEKEGRSQAIIQLFKQKKGKICECHVKKLEKRMSQKIIKDHV